MQQKFSLTGDLVEVKYERKELSKDYDFWETEFHQIKIKADTEEQIGDLTKFLNKLIKIKKGMYLVPKEEHVNRKMHFIEKRMKPIKVGISGKEFEDSRLSLFKAVFEDSEIVKRRPKDKPLVEE